MAVPVVVDATAAVTMGMIVVVFAHWGACLSRFGRRSTQAGACREEHHPPYSPIRG